MGRLKYFHTGLASHDLPAILDLVATGRLQPDASIQRRVTLQEGCDAIVAMDSESKPGITMIDKL